MGSNTYITMKCVIIVISLLIVVVSSQTTETVVTGGPGGTGETGENKDYPYPTESNGTHVCTRLEEDDECDWITNDEFNKQFLDEIVEANQQNAEEEDIKGLFGKYESYFSGCHPYCQNNGAKPWIDSKKD